MAKKISQLTQATQVKSDDVTVIVQDGETKKLPLNMMVTKQDIENKKVAGLAKLDEIETTYENDTYTPTITVKNKSSVKVGEGDGVDYSANVMDGHAKSAILSGQTLVNSFNTYDYQYGGYWGIIKFKNKLMTTSKKYIAIIQYLPNGFQWAITTENGTMQLDYSKNLYSIFTPTVNGSESNFFLHINDNGVTTIDLSELEKVKPMIIEYQEGMENWDIPYFEGMQSVKLPVLKTVGKNLFDGLSYIDGFVASSNDYTVSYDADVTSILVNVNKNTDYILSAKTNFNRNAVGGSLKPISTGTKTTSLNSERISNNTIKFNSGEYTNVIIYLHSSKIDIEDIQVEEGTVATSYEPYKSNILTVNEDVELRGIGEVQDTLDCLTGQMIERIGEIVLDGSGFYINNQDETSITFVKDGNPMIASMNRCINNRFSNLVYVNGTIKINVNISEFADINEFKESMAQNNLIIQFHKKDESVKTVDLIPSGTHPSTTPYCWKNGHIQLSSSGLLPNLEYSVVTSRAGQINQNATMIVKNDKRIFDLEILLAGGLVNTTYQALILQNQVETGLSKVSLSSETEPDYLLYHMIMKLIEEKAYKLDDLTEKVSVFYLYEKLSDEQFETIYSALYPFVEDEIVEEPVVEELPEVVEDEVIM